MATTKKQLPKRGSVPKHKQARNPKVPRRAKSEPLIPTSENIPPTNLLDYCIAIHGVKGIGKTSLVAQIPGVLVCQFEPRRRNLRIRQKSLRYWTVKDLKKHKPELTPWQEFKMVIEAGLNDSKIRGFALDTIDRCYDSCMYHVCYEIGVSDPGAMNDYGATWRAVSDEFESTLNEILYAEKTLVFTSHSTWKEVDTDTGENFEMLMPTAKKQPTDYMKAVADVVMYYGYHNTERTLTVSGSQHCWTACGPEENFFTKSGERVKNFFAGETPKDAWKNIQDAFDNKLTEASIPEDEEEE